jgi:hypothetical protein
MTQTLYAHMNKKKLKKIKTTKKIPSFFWVSNFSFIKHYAATDYKTYIHLKIISKYMYITIPKSANGVRQSSQHTVQLLGGTKWGQ